MFVQGAVPVWLTNGTQLDVSKRSSPATKLHSVSPCLPEPLKLSEKPKKPSSEFSASKYLIPPVTVSLSVKS